MALSSADASPGTYWAVFDWVLGVRPPQEQRVDPTPTPGTLLSRPWCSINLQVFPRGVLREAGPEGGSVHALSPLWRQGGAWLDSALMSGL